MIDLAGRTGREGRGKAVARCAVPLWNNTWWDARQHQTESDTDAAMLPCSKKVYVSVSRTARICYRLFADGERDSAAG
jgi:hypothetical protein